MVQSPGTRRMIADNGYAEQGRHFCDPLLVAHQRGCRAALRRVAKLEFRDRTVQQIFNTGPAFLLSIEPV